MPAFAGATGVVLEDGAAEGCDVATDARRWSFRGDAPLTAAPVVVTVYAASATGRLYGLRLDDGDETWATQLAAPVLAPDERNTADPQAGMSAGEGLLVLPATNVLYAFDVGNSVHHIPPMPAAPNAKPSPMPSAEESRAASGPQSHQFPR